ncbi:hypothetical protein PAXRUDRAFT_382610 [Paxillus rubicundulus Ve08.2h10]|uniref:Uncharacterized protein n=1 Tax=Paxillus rubicundulus Ve08.2h10 TaxID=930991 RepID=A0A0D0ECV1_9AGAM|nr:hypothetical protein PAXRUDRAFT_382610 [Paxillus rubicundulus Ve08.2h10]
MNCMIVVTCFLVALFSEHPCYPLSVILARYLFIFIDTIPHRRSVIHPALWALLSSIFILHLRHFVHDSLCTVFAYSSLNYFEESKLRRGFRRFPLIQNQFQNDLQNGVETAPVFYSEDPYCRCSSLPFAIAGRKSVFPLCQSLPVTIER